MLCLVCGYTAASVLDSQDQRLGDRLGLKGDTALFGVLEGIVCKGVDDAAEHVPVGLDGEFRIELAVDAKGMVMGDKIFPSIAFHLSPFTAVVFIIGMVAAGYSSADGTLTALTTTFCYDFLGFDRREDTKASVRLRRWVHVGFALLYLLVIVAFRPFHTQSLIDTLFDIAGFTYGPLLGLYTFGLFTKQKVKDRWVPVVAVLAPVLSFELKRYMPLWTGYHFGFEILLVNGLLTFLGLMAIREKKNNQ